MKRSLTVTARLPLMIILAALLTVHVSVPLMAAAQPLEVVIPVLGISAGPAPHGMVTYASVSVERSEGAAPFEVEFAEGPGEFSEESKDAVTIAIHRAVDRLGLTLTRFRAVLRALDPQIIIYGRSLSAMMALATVALAHGYIPTSDCAVTGTIEPDGRIGAVGSVPEKIAAAAQARYARVLVPDEPTTYETEWRTPFLMQVSPVRTIVEAYTAFTGTLVHHDVTVEPGPNPDGSGPVFATAAAQR